MQAQHACASCTNIPEPEPHVSVTREEPGRFLDETGEVDRDFCEECYAVLVSGMFEQGVWRIGGGRAFKMFVGTDEFC